MSRPSFVRKLTRAEQQHIRAALKDRDGRIVRRAQVVWFSSQGQKVQQIAGLLGLSEAAVARIIKAFSQRGVEALPDKPRSGRPCKATEGYVASLKEAVSKSPRDFEYVFSCWTLNRLREHRRVSKVTSAEVGHRLEVGSDFGVEAKFRLDDSNASAANQLALMAQ